MAFGTTRSYVRDRAALPGGGRPGLPCSAGNRVVRRNFEETGTGIVEATFLPADEIVRGSDDFDGA